MKIPLKKIKDMTADDFPGIDQAKFEKWKAGKINENLFHMIGIIIFFVLIIIQSFIFGTIGYVHPYSALILFISMLVVFWPNITGKIRRLKKLAKELNMDERQAELAEKERSFTG
jgi:hypothetical protein